MQSVMQVLKRPVPKKNPNTNDFDAMIRRTIGKPLFFGYNEVYKRQVNIHEIHLNAQRIAGGGS